MYLLCAYKTNTYDNYPKVVIIGIYETIEKASEYQEKLCGKISKIGNSWNGRNYLCSWVFHAKTDENGTLEKAIDTRYTSNAIFLPKTPKTSKTPKTPKTPKSPKTPKTLKTLKTPTKLQSKKPDLTINTDDINPFPPKTNAHLSYELGSGFPPLYAAPNLWEQQNKTPPIEVIKSYLDYF